MGERLLSPISTNANIPSDLVETHGFYQRAGCAASQTLYFELIALDAKHI